MTDLSSRRKFMQEALNAARQTSARVSPNPRVGAVLVKGDKIIARGWHNGSGTAHAEVMAIHAAGPAVAGSTLYVTLEPCNHFGRTPPCTKAIIEAGISKVHVALSDPNPQVFGRGTARLRQAGIDVIYDDEARDDAAELNRPYLTWMTKHRPWVMLKTAQSLDGKVASSFGESQYISGPKALSYVHDLRGDSDAILVGVATIIADNPQLTCRGASDRPDPLRVILDTHGRTPPTSRVCNQSSSDPTWIYTSDKSPEEWRKAMTNRDVRVITVPTLNNRIDLPEVIRDLADHGIQSLMVEGGPMVHAGFIAIGLVDEWQTVISPIVLGGNGPGAVGGLGFHLSQAPLFRIHKITPLDRDMLIVARPVEDPRALA